jgi:hypothetical protein
LQLLLQRRNVAVRNLRKDQAMAIIRGINKFERIIG